MFLLCVILSVIIKSQLADSRFSASILGPQGDRTEYPGVNVTFNCSVFGDTTADNIVWTKDGKAVNGRNILGDAQETKRWSVVLLSNVSVQDDGRYTCKLTKGNLQDSDSILLRVYDAPSVKKFATSKIVKDGDSPEITCQASGWPMPELSWWKNGEKILGDDADFLYELTTPSKDRLSMKIMLVDGLQHGTYTCIANNTIGESNASFQLIVKRDDLISEPSRPTISIEGTDATLQCHCYKDKCKENNITAYWRDKRSEIIRPSSKYHITRQLSSEGLAVFITILNASSADGGTYWCGVNTSVGIDLKPRDLKVLSRDTGPRAYPMEGTVSVKSQSTASLKCYVTYPSIMREPDAFWAVNGSVIPTSRPHYTVTKYGDQVGQSQSHSITFELRIFNTTAQDADLYTCGFNFTTGLVDANITLNLQENSNANSDEPDSRNSPLVAISSITAGGTILGLVVALLAYRLCRNKRNPEEFFSASPINGRKFNYDVFVTFSSLDLDWVKLKLTPLIESHQLKYCTHNRDFEIGKAVVDNMADSVYSSRKVLAVMSKNYLSSKFCRGELEMALYRSTEMGDCSVIVVRIDETDRNKLPKALRNRTFLDYHDSTERKTWKERLIKHLKPPVPKSTEKKNFFKVSSEPLIDKSDIVC